MTSAMLISKVHIPQHFTPNKAYKAIYDFDGMGWFTVDDTNNMHWLSPNDGKPHDNIYKEEWITKNFHVVEAK